MIFKYRTCILIICLPLVISFMGCREKCKDEPFPQIGEVLIEAYREPETFDDYVAQNQDLFNERFMSCSQQRIDDLQRKSNEEKKRCDDIFTPTSPEWNQCYNEAEVTYDNGVIIMSDILSVIRGTNSFLDTQTGATLAYLKSDDQSGYNDAINLLEQTLNEVPITCEQCEERFLFF